MAYATQADLERHDADGLHQLVGDGTGWVDAARIDAAIATAGGIIDSYARARYAVPLAVEPVITDCAVKLSWFELQATRPSAEARASRDDAMRWLRDLADGRITLGAGQSAPAADVAGTPILSAPAAVFSDSFLAGY